MTLNLNLRMNGLAQSTKKSSPSSLDVMDWRNISSLGHTTWIRKLDITVETSPMAMKQILIQTISVYVCVQRAAELCWNDEEPNWKCQPARTMMTMMSDIDAIFNRAVGNWVKFQKSIYSCFTHIYAKKEGSPTSGGLCEDEKPCRQNLDHHFHEEKKMFHSPAIFGLSLTIISTYCQCCPKTR